MTSSFRRKNGFTLIETMLAIVIMASALILLTNSWSGSITRVRKTQQIFEIAALLERKMAEVEIEYRGKPLDSIPEEAEDSFGEEYPQYRWKLTSKKLEFPDLSAALTGQDGGVDQMMLSLIKQLSEGLSQSIKEVTVTVVFQPQGATKPIQHSVTTYFVDYDKPVTFGVPGA